MSPMSYIAVIDPGYAKPSPVTVAQPTQSPVPGSAQPTPTPSMTSLPRTGTSSLVPVAIMAAVLLLACGTALAWWFSMRRRREACGKYGRHHGL